MLYFVMNPLVQAAHVYIFYFWSFLIKINKNDKYLVTKIHKYNLIER